MPNCFYRSDGCKTSNRTTSDVSRLLVRRRALKYHPQALHDGVWRLIVQAVSQPVSISRRIRAVASPCPCLHCPDRHPPRRRPLEGEDRSAASTGGGKLMKLTPERHKLLVAVFKAMDVRSRRAAAAALLMSRALCPRGRIITASRRLPFFTPACRPMAMDRSTWPSSKCGPITWDRTRRS